MTELHEEIRDGVAVLTLHGPSTRNSFTVELGRQLGAAYQRLDDDPAVRVIVLTGAPPAFCSGAQISAAVETFAAPRNPDFGVAGATGRVRAENPVIAAVNGHAIGIGMTLALHADIRILAEEGVMPYRRCGSEWHPMRWRTGRCPGWSVPR